MDGRDMESEMYEDQHPPPAYYGATKAAPGAPLLPTSPPIFDPQSAPNQMQPMTAAPLHGDQIAMVAMAAPKTGGNHESGEGHSSSDSYGGCHMMCSFISVFLCLFSGLLALVCAITGYTDFRTGNTRLYRQKRCCAIGWVVVSWVCAAVVIGLYWYLSRQTRHYDDYGK